jgi:hypothetical protein
LPWLAASRCVPPCSEAVTSRRVRAREKARRRTLGVCHRAPAASSQRDFLPESRTRTIQR